MRPRREFLFVLVLFMAILTVLADRLEKDGSCPLISLLPFSGLPSQAFTHLAAILLAVEDFNNRNAGVVPKLSAPLYQNCQATFPSVVFSDTNMRTAPTAQVLLNEVSAGHAPCSIIGPWANEPAQAAVVVSAGLSLPLISHGATDTVLSMADRHPYVARTMVNIHAIGEAVVDFIKSKGRTDFVGVLATTQEITQQWYQALSNAARESNPPVTLFYQAFNPRNKDKFVPNSARWAMKELKDSSYRTIVVALAHPRDYFQLVADAAEEFQMNGDDYMYVFSEAHTTDFLNEASNENMTKLLRGSAIVKPIDTFLYQAEKDNSFLQRWRSTDPSFVQRLNDANPVPNTNPSHYQAQNDYFLTEQPQWGAGFAYDAVMAVGMAACRALNNSDDSSSSHNKPGESTGNSEKSNNDGDESEEGQSRSHFAEILQSNFIGASGIVELGEGKFPGNRVRDTVTFGAFNVRMKETESGMEGILTDVLLPNRWLQTAWDQVEGEEFIYANGTPNPPKLLRDVPEQNFLSKGVRILGFFMMSFSLALCLCSLVFIFTHQNSRPVKASQPPFLFALCFGAICMTLSMLTLSFDESNGWSNGQLNIACAMFPWFLALGHTIIYCALFSKLWRLNKVVQFSRVKIKTSQVVWPFILLVLGTMAVLAVWTIIDPFRWERNIIDDFTGESYGRCDSDHAMTFVAVLIVLMATPTVMAFGMAWKTKDIRGIFGESHCIFYTIFVQIQVLLVAIPILVILESESADATYLGRILVIWTFPVSTVGLMVGPKMLAVRQDRPNNSDQRRRIRYQGNAGPVVTISGMQRSVDQSTQQSMDQSTLQSVDQSTLQSVDRSTLQSVDQSTLYSVNQSTLQSVDQSTLQSVDQSTSHSDQSTS